MNGYKLKELRKEFKMTQKELADKSGLGLSTIKQLETGEVALLLKKFRSIKQKQFN